MNIDNLTFGELKQISQTAREKHMTKETISDKQAHAMAQVCLDLHDALGCKWGDNPYLTISQLKAAAPVQETAGWKWHQAPVKTQWGHKMVVADLAIDKDNTVSVYCERDQTTKVEAMFNPPAQPAVPLTERDLASACLSYRHDFGLMDETNRGLLMVQARAWARAFGLSAAAAPGFD
jgi:hypothetical protein